MRIVEIIMREQATAGATSAGSIATVTSPHIAIGKDRGNKAKKSRRYGQRCTQFTWR